MVGIGASKLLQIRSTWHQVCRNANLDNRYRQQNLVVHINIFPAQKNFRSPISKLDWSQMKDIRIWKICILFSKYLQKPLFFKYHTKAYLKIHCSLVYALKSVYIMAKISRKNCKYACLLSRFYRPCSTEIVEHFYVL